MNAEKKESILEMLDNLTFLFNGLVLSIDHEEKDYLLFDDPKTVIRKHAYKFTDSIAHLKGLVKEIPIIEDIQE